MKEMRDSFAPAKNRSAALKSVYGNFIDYPIQIDTKDIVRCFVWLRNFISYSA